MKKQYLVARGASNNQPPTDSAPNQVAAIAPSRPRRAMLSLRAVTMALLILSSLTRNAAGVIPLGGTVTTSGDQIYNDAVVLISDTTVMSTGGGNIVFNATVDGPYRLTIITDGVAILNGPVGQATPLMSLTTDTGTTLLNGGTVTTLGAQTYNRAVVLGANLNMASIGGGIIIFNSTVDGMQALTVATTGVSVFNGAVGGTAALTSLVTDIGGATFLNGGSVTTTGAQTYSDAVTLLSNTTLTASQAIIAVSLTTSSVSSVAATLINTGRILVNGGTLNFLGPVTNSGMIQAGAGGVLSFFGSVFNAGVIDALAGKVTFSGGLSNNGTVADATSFRLTTIRRVGNDIRLTWSTMAGHRYVVQATAPSAGGGYTKTFADLGPILSAPGNAQSTLSYNHVTGTTASRSRFYRVRLVE